MTIRDVIETRAKAFFRFNGDVDTARVSERVLRVVSEQTGIPTDRITIDSHIIRDLGLD
jgi:hypothetical protein